MADLEHTANAPMEGASDLPSRELLGARVHAVGIEQATRRILAWAQRGRSGYVCAANAQMLVLARDAAGFGAVLEGADMVVPDSRMTTWAMRWLGARRQEQVRGPDLMLALCAEAARRGVPVGFYGSSPEVVERLADNMTRRFRGLSVVYRHSPPYWPLSADEDAQVTAEIAASGARLVFVGLGCPKQEQWMAAHRGRFDAIMVGVGMAFDIHSGRLPDTPRWIQRAGLEWLYRFVREPRRLWHRNVVQSPQFLFLLLSQLLRPSARERMPGGGTK